MVHLVFSYVLCYNEKNKINSQRRRPWNSSRSSKNAKSVRTYADTPISQEVLDHILQVGELAPTSRNLKPCTFHLIQDSEILQRLSKAKKAEMVLRGRIFNTGKREVAAA